MKHVVIELRKEGPVVISAPKKIQVVFRKPKKKTLKKRLRTLAYKFKTFLGAQ